MLVWSPTTHTLRLLRTEGPDSACLEEQQLFPSVRAAEFLLQFRHQADFRFLLLDLIERDGLHRIAHSSAIAELVAAAAERIVRRRVRVMREMPASPDIDFEPGRPFATEAQAAVRFPAREAAREAAGAVLASARDQKKLLAAITATLRHTGATAWGHAVGAPASQVRGAAARPDDPLEKAATLLVQRRLLLLAQNVHTSLFRLAWAVPFAAGTAPSPPPPPPRSSRQSPAPAAAPAALPPPSGDSPQAAALIEAAEDGAPFCEECAAAAALELAEA
jgi:hypothetical protein